MDGKVGGMGYVFARVSPPESGGVDAPKARTGWFQSRHFYECILEMFRLGNHPVCSLRSQPPLLT
jgi:hypothetical protein